MAAGNNQLAANVRDGHDRGWSFTRLKGKRPILKDWQQGPQETLERALAWAQKGNVGLRTGQASGVVVIDVDPGADVSGLDLPPTVKVNTGRPGAFHLYFRCTRAIGNSAGKLGQHVDVRGDGGQVVYPGSVHPETGRRYEWAMGLAPWEVEVAELPQHILHRLNGHDVAADAAHVGPTRPRAAGGERYAKAALEGELNALRAATEGNRNETLNTAAFNLGTLVGGGHLNRQEVEQALQPAAEAVGLEPEEVKATVRSGLEAGIRQPRDIPDRRPPTAVPDLPAHRFRLDLYGNADRFMHLFGQDVLWCEAKGQWLVWDGRIWNPDAVRGVSCLAELAMRAILKEAANANDDETTQWAVRCNQKAQSRREMIDVVKHRVAVRIDQFDQNPWLLGVGNGVIDLKTGRLLPHAREQMITRLCPSTHDPDALCPRWEQFLREIMNGDAEMIACLQRMAGYFLTGDISVQILPIFYGPGGNGKNVFLDTLMGIMGPHAAEAPEGLLTARITDEHPTEIADLYGKRLVVASETEEGRRMRIGLVKKLTGNRYLKGRFMRQDYFQFERTHKTVLVTNNRPVVTETSNAVWRRLRLISFTVTIPEEKQDKHLTERLVAEWPGILAWAVRGCLDWQKRQCDLALPNTVQDATEEYRNDSDAIGDFLQERCTVAGDLKVSRSSLYQAFVEWAKGGGEEMLSGKAFASRMRSRGFNDSA
ncbi:MAG TPA: phage/plasmid primase, P4 family, partial [Phycisphaerae bacterium]|nr:phage/plasmid primase, P4 family [Phycisphaerae bacterium]